MLRQIPLVNFLRILVLGFLVVPATAPGEDKALSKATATIDQQSHRHRFDSTTIQVSGDSTELTARVAPPDASGNPAQAGVRLRQKLSETVAVRGESHLQVHAPQSSPGTSGLPPMQKRESLVLEWIPSDQVKAEGFSHIIGNTEKDHFLDWTDWDRGISLSLRPSSSTQTTLTANHRQGLERAASSRQGTWLDAELSQKLGTLPVKATVAPSIETAQEDSTATTTISSRQALVWNASADTVLSAGTRWAESASSQLANSQQTMEAFTRWDRTISPDLSFNAKTSLESQHRSDLLSTKEHRKISLHAGPTYRVTDDLTASLNFKSSFEQREGRGPRDSEQAVSFSLNGKF
ncbi:MAG: hypothetical protein OHK005_05280 [Candidatus Methylacidiphilales bacterium]